MKYLPILEELFSSNSIIFLPIGVIIAVAVGLMLKSYKKITVGMIVSIVVYALCEVFLNISESFLSEFIALFIGTIGIGGFIGFLIASVVLKIKKKK